jgi:hypothetical protein
MEDFGVEGWRFVGTFYETKDILFIEAEGVHENVGELDGIITAEAKVLHMVVLVDADQNGTFSFELDCHGSMQLNAST